MAKQRRRTLDISRAMFRLPAERPWTKERRRLRVYQGEEDGIRVTRWLNGDPKELAGWKKGNSPASRKRIMDLLSNLRDILGLMEEIDPEFDWLNQAEPKRFKELDLELLDRLSEYPTVPYFFTGYYGRQWFIEDAEAGRRPIGESTAAHSIIRLAKQGLLDRIAQCACGKWFFARFQHQRSCSASCRRNLYEKTEAFREKRRRYMRKYYRLKNSGKVK